MLANPGAFVPVPVHNDFVAAAFAVADRTDIQDCFYLLVAGLLRLAQLVDVVELLQPARAARVGVMIALFGLNFYLDEIRSTRRESDGLVR